MYRVNEPLRPSPLMGERHRTFAGGGGRALRGRWARSRLTARADLAIVPGPEEGRGVGDSHGDGSMSATARGKGLSRPTKAAPWPCRLGAVLALGLAIAAVLPPPAAAPSPGERLADPIDRARRATVGILRDDQRMAAAPTKAHFTIRGTGVHLRDGHIVTARHAVTRQEGSRTVLAETIGVLTEDFHELSAVLVGFSEFLDLAVYRVDPESASSILGTASLGEREPDPGDDVFTVGYPLGWGPTVGFGHVGNPHTFLPTLPSRLLQLDLAACSGNSGGGLFNTNGDLVGFVHAIIQAEGLGPERRCSWMAFGVPAQLAGRVINALIKGEGTAFPRLGLGLTSVRLGARWRVAVSDATGPAQEAGFQKGDILLAIEGTEVVSAAQLKSYLLEWTQPGQRVRMTVLRDREETVLTVTLGRS